MAPGQNILGPVAVIGAQPTEGANLLRYPHPVPARSVSGMVSYMPMMYRFSTYDDVPWYRKSVVASAALILGLFAPPLIWAVCYLLITGDIYRRPKEGMGLSTWGPGNRWAAWIIVSIQLALIVHRFAAVFFP